MLNTKSTKTLHNTRVIDAEMNKEASLLYKLGYSNVTQLYGLTTWSSKIALVLELNFEICVIYKIKK